MGITTIGMNLASALINWILSGLSGQFQISGALSILGGVVILLAILLGIFVKATPEELAAIRIMTLKLLQSSRQKKKA